MKKIIITLTLLVFNSCAHVQKGHSSRSVAQVEQGSYPFMHRSLIRSTNQNLGSFNLKNIHQRFKSTRAKTSPENIANCPLKMDIAFSFLSAEYLMSEEYYQFVTKEELTEMLMHFMELVSPLTPEQVELGRRRDLIKLVNKRLNDELVYRKEAVFIFSLLLYNFRDRFPETFEEFVPVLINVAKYDSVSLIRRIAQLAIADFMTNKEELAEFLLHFDRKDGDVIFDGNCRNKKNYSFLSADLKGSEIVVEARLPSKEIPLDIYLIQECSEPEFGICDKNKNTGITKVTRSEYEKYVSEARKTVLSKIDKNIEMLEKGFYQGDDLLRVFNENIETLDRIITRYEVAKSFSKDEEEKERRLFSDAVYQKLVRKKKLYKERVLGLENSLRETALPYLKEVREKVYNRDWYETPKGRFSNGVTSQIAFDNGFLAYKLKAKVLNKEPVDFWLFALEYAKENHFGFELSKRVLEGAK